MLIFGLYKKAEKVLPPSSFWRVNFFSSKFYVLSSIWIYKLLASRITENSSNCYTLNISTYKHFLGFFNYLLIRKLPKTSYKISSSFCITVKPTIMNSLPENKLWWLWFLSLRFDLVSSWCEGGIFSLFLYAEIFSPIFLYKVTDFILCWCTKF